MGQKADEEAPVVLEPQTSPQPVPVVPTVSVLKATRVDDIPTASVVVPTLESVPTRAAKAVRKTTTAADVPYAKRPAKNANFPPRYGPDEDAILKPDAVRPQAKPAQPQVVKALGVLGCMIVLAVVCLAVISFAVLYGLKKAKRTTAQVPEIHDLARIK